MIYVHSVIAILLLLQQSHSQEPGLNFTSVPACLGFPGGFPGGGTDGNFTDKSFTGESFINGNLPDDSFPGGNFSGENISDESFTGETGSTDGSIIGCHETPQSLCKKCNIIATDCTREKQDFIFALIDWNADACITKRVLNCSRGKTINQIKAVFNIVCGVVGLIGNFVIILVTIMFRQKASRCHCLIAGLSLVDFIFSAFQIALHIPDLWTCEWLYGLGMCKFLHSTLNLSYMLALGFILLISIERYVGIVYPFSKWLTDATLWILISANITLGIAASIPGGVYLKIKKYEEGKESCEETWPNDWSSLIYSYLMLFAYFLIPIGVIIFLDTKIVITLRTAASKNSVVDENQRIKRLNNNKRIMKILISILIAFVVLVFPNRITWVIIDHIGKDNLTTTGKDALTLFGFIPYAFHTAINPIIYSLIDLRFRNKLKSLFNIYRNKMTHDPETVSTVSCQSPCMEMKNFTIPNSRNASQ